MKYRLLHIILSLFIVTSCEDFLNQEPDLQISFDEQLSTKTGVLQAYNGIYRDIESVFSSKFAVYADALGGNITFTPSILGQNTVNIPSEIEFAYNFNATPQELNFDDYYDDWYDIINQVNLLLDRFDSFSFFNTTELNQLQAELLTIRALAHYQLTLLFAQNYGFTANASHLGIVYNTTVLIAGEDFPSRGTMAETYALIQMDLDNAISRYNNTQLLSGPSYSYFNAINTQALYARIALQMGDWQKAFDNSNTVIATSGVALMDRQDYINQWEQDELPVSEILIEFTAPRTSEGNVSSSISANFEFSSINDFAAYSASGDLLNLYDSEDIRTNMFLQESIETNVNGVNSFRDYFFTKKFQGNAGTTFMRLSELYLIRAEANARLNNPNNALLDLNVIRERANLSALTSTNTILDDIFEERRRELAFENFLFFDIARYNKNVERDLGCIATLCNLSYPSSFFILPIPEENVLQNENMQQNEGY